MSFRTDITINWQRSPRLIKLLAPSVEVSIQDLVDTLRVLEYTPIPGYDVFSYDYIIDAAGKEDLGGGVKVGLTAEFKNAQLAPEARTTSAESGTATSADSTGQTLIDTAATFQSNGVEAGSVIINFTDGSVATVLDVVGENELYHEPLADGIDNQWEIGDNYKVWNIEIVEISGGNLVAVDENDSGINALLPRFGVSYIATRASSATLQEQEAIQYASYNEGVTVDITSIYSGTTYPVGTPQQPVNNMTDALSIALERGLYTFYVVGNLTVTIGLDFTDFTFIGASKAKTEITIPDAAQVDNAEFVDCFVEGYLDGETVLRDCRIGDLNYVKGVIDRCVLEGSSITLLGDGVFLDCYSGNPEQGTPEIDLGASGKSLTLRNYNGSISLKNKSGSDPVEIDLASGEVILQSTVINGDVTIRGVGTVDNQSTLDCNVICEDLLNPANIVTQTLSGVIDPSNPVSLKDSLFAILSALTGKATGGGTSTITFRDHGDTADAIVMTVDENGNRSAVTINFP